MLTIEMMNKLLSFQRDAKRLTGSLIKRIDTLEQPFQAN